GEEDNKKALSSEKLHKVKKKKESSSASLDGKESPKDGSPKSRDKDSPKGKLSKSRDKDSSPKDSPRDKETRNHRKSKVDILEVTPENNHVEEEKQKREHTIPLSLLEEEGIEQ